MSGGIYVPDNDRLLAVLDGLPRGLRRYRDSAAIWIYFIARRQWSRCADEDEGPTRLHSLILRQYIPDRAVRPLREYLEAHGVLICDAYSVGHHSIGYRIGEDFGGLPRRWALSDERLIAKWQSWKTDTIKNDTPEMCELARRRKPVTDAMHESLDSLKLCAAPQDVERALGGCGIDPAHLRYVTNVIANGDHDGLCMDDFGWRVHSIVTNTAAAIRPFLSLGDGPLVELDVRNAQPLILAAALRNPPICATYVGNAQHNGEETGVPTRLVGLLRSVPVQEVEEFARLCEAGQFYEALVHAPGRRERERTKLAVFRDVFFGKLVQHGPVSDVFKNLWPGIHRMIRTLKAERGYKIVAQILQRMESSIMIDGVCGRIVTELPEVRFLTIHDAALVVAGQAGEIGRLIEAEFQRYGVRATVRQENLGEERVDTSRSTKARDGMVTPWPDDDGQGGIRLRFKRDITRFEPKGDGIQ